MIDAWSHNGAVNTRWWLIATRKIFSSRDTLLKTNIVPEILGLEDEFRFGKAPASAKSACGGVENVQKQNNMKKHHGYKLIFGQMAFFQFFYMNSCHQCLSGILMECT